MHRRHLVTALAIIAAGTVAVAPADAATKKKPKPFKGSKSFTDQTIDPTGSLPESRAGCDSAVPTAAPWNKETPISVKIPAPGKLKVSLANQLDWAIDILDSKKNVIASVDGADVDTVEIVTAKVRKAGTYYILPCNVTGEPTTTVNWQYTPA